MTFDQQILWHVLLPLLKSFQSKDPFKLTVGFSGGLDSTVLLYALHKLQFSTNAFQLSAFHINHQLQSESDNWQQFCESFCLEQNIPFPCARVEVKKKGKGIEAAAREARYNMLKKSLDKDELLLTAHHLDDNIETVLFNFRFNQEVPCVI